MIAPSFRPISLRALWVVICLSLALTATAVAQDEQLELRSSADYIYGQSLNFNLFAANMGEIEGVTLFFRLGTSSDTYSVDIPVSPGPRIEITYPLDMAQIRLPPFGSITYWWQLNREFGSPLRVPEQVVSYVDDQFVWRRLVSTDEQGGGSIRIHWTGDSETLGEQARDIIFEMLPDAGRLIPLNRILPFDVYIYPSSGDLSAALRLAGRDFQPGQTYPDLGVILATVVNQETAEGELRSELSRGLVDLLLYQALGQLSDNLPPWLVRGLAGAVRDENDVSLDNALLSALATNSTLSLEELCAGMAIEDDMAAAQSESYVAHIIEAYGEAAVRRLVIAFAEGKDCQAAIPAAIQQTPDQLEASWLRARSSDQGNRDVAEIGVWLGLLLAGFGLAGLLLLWPRRRSHRR